MKHELPALRYAYDALQPYIDSRTMEVHHTKHHQTYIDNLNRALLGTAFEGMSLEAIFSKITQAPAAIRNNAGGHYNHTLFWNMLKPSAGGAPVGALAKMIDTTFGSFDTFKQKFAEAATGRFGSGWAWLVLTHDHKLVISTTPYQDNPLMADVDQPGFPMLGVDVWEHAYYLNYQNRRADYINAFWQVVDWEFVGAVYDRHKMNG